MVSPTIAAVGLSFFSFGFPRVGSCIEIGVVQILLVIVFSLVSSMTNLNGTENGFIWKYIILICFSMPYFVVPSEDISFGSSGVPHLHSRLCFLFYNSLFL